MLIIHDLSYICVCVYIYIYIYIYTASYLGGISAVSIKEIHLLLWHGTVSK